MEQVHEQYIDEQDPRGMAPPMNYGASDKADLLERIKPDLIVEIIRHRLLGEELVDGVWEKVEAFKDRALSEKGAWEISNLMLPVSSQNVSISKLTNDEIRERTFNIAREAQLLCIKNWKEYGIVGADQLGLVHQIVFSNTFITLKQPEGEGIRKMLMGTIQEQNLRQDSHEKKGWSLFGGRK
jgi:hypothetical protein